MRLPPKFEADISKTVLSEQGPSPLAGGARRLQLIIVAVQEVRLWKAWDRGLH